MAPEHISVPPSPRNPSSMQAPTSHPSSRRTSQIFPMSPPPLPLASPGGAALPTAQSNYNLFPPLSPGLTGSNPPGVDGSGIPIRHPRPLTPAELHLELEKEQEAMVNRLTRELTALRAHTASVASTASSTSNAPGLLLDSTDPGIMHSGPVPLTGHTHPTSSRRHRSSSSVSRSSISIGPGPYTSSVGIPLSSATANIPHSHHRHSVSSQLSASGSITDATHASTARSVSLGLSSPRYEEMAHHKQELEEAKKENDMLRRRIRELEVQLREARRTSAGNMAGPEGREDERGRPNLSGASAVGGGANGDSTSAA